MNGLCPRPAFSAAACTLALIGLATLVELEPFRAASQNDPWSVEAVPRPEVGGQVIRPAFQVSEGGAMVAAWVERRGLQSSVVVVAYRPAGGAWTSRVVSARGFIRAGPLLSLDHRGNAQIVWDRARRRGGRVVSAGVEAAYVPASSGRAGGTHRVSGPRLAGSPFLATTSDDGGERLLAWVEVSANGVRQAYAARSRLGRARFHARTRVSRPAEDAPAPVAALRDDGQAAIAWSARRDGGRLLTVVRRTPTSKWLAPTSPSAGRPVRGDIAVAGGPRRIVVVWEEGLRNGRARLMGARAVGGRVVTPFGQPPIGRATGGRPDASRLARPHLDMAEDGSAVLTWSRLAASGRDQLLFASDREQSSGGWRSTPLGKMAPRLDGVPAAAPGGGLAVWFGAGGGAPLVATGFGPADFSRNWGRLKRLPGAGIRPSDPERAVASAGERAIIGYVSAPVGQPWQLLVARWRGGNVDVAPPEVAALGRASEPVPLDIAAGRSAAAEAVLFANPSGVHVAIRPVTPDS